MGEKFCAKCCYNTEMPLTREDIERIKALGYEESYFVVVGPDGVPRLRNVDDACVFLDRETGRCKIYSHRPLGCRLYPLVCIPEQGVVLDPECPKLESIDPRQAANLQKYLARLVEKIYGIKCPA